MALRCRRPGCGALAEMLAMRATIARGPDTGNRAPGPAPVPIEMARSAPAAFSSGDAEVVVIADIRQFDTPVGQLPVMQASRRRTADLEAGTERSCTVLAHSLSGAAAGMGSQSVNLQPATYNGATTRHLGTHIEDPVLADALDSVQ